MKIITEDRVYVQKNDLSYLLNGLITEKISIPSSIVSKVLPWVFTVDDCNKYEFIEFEKENEISFFNNLDFIIDYNDFYQMTDNAIVEAGSEASSKKNQILRKFYSLSEKERVEKCEDVSLACEILDYKFCSIRDILWYKRGILKFDIPNYDEFIEKYSKNKPQIMKKIINKFSFNFIKI